MTIPGIAPDPALDIAPLQRLLQARADPQTKQWWERYLKHVIPFRGAKMADIRRSAHEWLAANSADDSPAARAAPRAQLDAALTLLRQSHAEDKLAGVIILHEFLIPSGAVQWRSDLPRLAALFADGCIYDWNTCDWFCVKALAALWRREGEECARAIAKWRSAPNLWQRRAACVAFVPHAKRGDENFPGFTDMLIEVCAAAIQSEERFAQTGAGWALRELATADQDRVAGFIEANAARFSAEGMRYATERMPPDLRARLRQLRRDAQRGARRQGK